VAAQEGALLAPYDGVVVARPLAEGALAGAATPAIAVASADVEIVASVDEARIGEVKSGQAATIRVPAYPGVLFPARVAAITPSADARTHTFPVKVRPEPQDARLLPGMFAEVAITTREKDGIVLVPKDAVVLRGGKPQVYVVEDGRVRAVDVSGGLADDENAEAPSGVEPGDQVVVQGQAPVNDGDAVRPQRGAAGRPEGARGAAAAPEKAPAPSAPLG
jgi:RND family efflux transporter MFP subunit